MSSSLDLDNKKMESVSLVATRIGYSRDHVTKLARDKKISAVQIGRRWFVEYATLQAYAKQSAAEQKIRQQQLSDTRKAEREENAKNLALEKIPTPYVKELARQKSVVAMMVLVVVAGTYSFFHFLTFNTVSQPAQVVGSAVAPEFKNAQTAYEIAIDTTISPQDPAPLLVDFSQQLVRLSDIKNYQNGILLLPSTSTADQTKPQDLFSDEVQILTDEFGQEYVARVNEQNEVVSEIPFVVVPVGNNQTTP